ncbi:MAG: hypothetical protein IK999_08750 [Ruminococcus sp.]|nr:hypothetical protein [Ruminococcus sp.]
MKTKKLLSSILCALMAIFFVLPSVSAADYDSYAEQMTSLTAIASNKTYADGWHKDSNGKYFYTVDDSKLTGWYTIDDSTYYFNSKGVMQTGWLNVGEDYYYLKSDGKMAENTTLTIGGKTYTFGSDGKYTAPKKQTTTRTYTQTTTKASTGTSHDYVLNTNTKKFHKPGCKSVNQMKDKNKKYYTGTRDEVIGMGYDPCKNCNP